MTADVSAMVLMAVLFLVTYAWISLLAKVLRGNEILAFEPRRETPWGLIAVILSFVVLIGSQIAAGLAFAAQPMAELTVAQTGALLIWTAVAIFAAAFASIGLIHIFTRAGRADFGISFRDVPRDLFTGVGAFLILAPITFAIQYVCVSVFGLESHHPLIELLKEDTSGRLFGVVSFLAVIVAPITEEYFFRVLLQGWLERHFLFALNDDREPVHEGASEAGMAFDDGQEGESRLTPKLASRRIISSLPTGTIDRMFATYSVPIVISAAVFALMHWSHGPDPAALFVLALGLGYLYQRTHRWLPSVVTHACLNGTTMLLLWFGLDELPP